MSVNVGALRLRTGEPQRLLIELVLMPTIYIRLVGILCSIIVFGCVADQVKQDSVCFFGFNTFNLDLDGDNNACNFAVAVGVIGFVLCLVFLVKDLLYVIIDYSDNIIIKKLINVVDIVANGIWAFMWFVCFCYTADRLRISGLASSGSGSIVNCMRAAVAFSFFSIIAWVAIVVVNVILLVRIMQGKDASAGQSGTGYASFPEGQSEQPYQGQGGGDEGGQQYSPPEY